MKPETDLKAFDTKTFSSSLLHEDSTRANSDMKIKNLQRGFILRHCFDVPVLARKKGKRKNRAWFVACSNVVKVRG